VFDAGAHGATGFDRGAAFFDAIRQDPVLTNVKLIAEPWDIGPGGYQLGAFPPPFMEWNDKYRDGVRRFWRGDEGHVPVMADRLTGSALQFDHSGRPATASVNMLTAHDGFTLADVVSFVERHNEANGEDNRDGHEANWSDNFGVEGPSSSPSIRAARALRRRNMMATLLLCQGTPMILAGDEVGNSQGGNNNAYCQDNETGWIDWAHADTDFLAFTQKDDRLPPRPPDPAAAAFPACPRTRARRAGGPVLVASRRHADDAGRLGRPGGKRAVRGASDGLRHARLCRTQQRAFPGVQRRGSGT
jgi:glycogen debranching enzyme GlgX